MSLPNYRIIRPKQEFVPKQKSQITKQPCSMNLVGTYNDRPIMACSNNGCECGLVDGFGGNLLQFIEFVNSKNLSVSLNKIGQELKFTLEEKIRIEEEKVQQELMKILNKKN